MNGKWGKRFAELHPRAFFLESWRAIDDEAAREREVQTGYDYRPLIAFTLGAACLTAMEYWGHTPTYRALLDRFDSGDGDNWVSRLRGSGWLELSDFAWWSGCRVLGYFLVPALVIRFGFRERVRDYGLETKNFREHAWMYGLAYLVVLVCVTAVSFESTFQTYYPFYRLANRSWLDFGLWEILYAAQFFSLEFFFRGFWLAAGRRSMGSHAIFAMVVPYCMIHYGKPVMETFAAIIAGVVLGTLAMKTRSIWSGFLIHVSVAISMDMAALLQTRGLPHHLLPEGLQF